MTGVKVKQRLTTLKEGELQLALYEKVFIPQDQKAKDFVDWLEENRGKIKSLFGDTRRFYIKPTTPEFAQELTAHVIKNQIGEHSEWIKCEDGDGWWFLVWWDLKNDLDL